MDQVPDRLVEFEALIMRYEAEPNVDALSDAIKNALLVRGCPEPLKTHLLMNLQTYVGHGSIRNAVQSYTEAKRKWSSEAAQASSSTDMEVDAVCKENRNVARGRAKKNKGDECYICGKRGHVQKDCWYKDTRGEKGKGKVKGKGKLPEFATHSPFLPRLDTGVVRNADGSEMPTPGRRRVRFRLEDGQIASVEFQVINVKRCVFSIGRLIEQDFRIDFEGQVLTGPDGRQAQIHRQGRLYHFRPQSLETERATPVNPVWVDEQGNENEMNEHGCRQRERPHSGRTDGCSDSKRCERASTTNREKERSEHSLTHVPFRSWCKACVLARSKENPHRPLTLSERKHKDKTTIPLDCMFPRGDGDCKVLTMTETKTGYSCATMVLAKGSGDRYAVHALKQMIDEVGDPEANIQTDSEGATVDLDRAEAALRPEGRHEVKVTPRGSSQSNGAVERMNQTVADMCRTCKVLEEDEYHIKNC